MFYHHLSYVKVMFSYWMLLVLTGGQPVASWGKAANGVGKEGAYLDDFCSELITETLAYLRGAALYLYTNRIEMISQVRLLYYFFHCKNSSRKDAEYDLLLLILQGLDFFCLYSHFSQLPLETEKVI